MFRRVMTMIVLGYGLACAVALVLAAVGLSGWLGVAPSPSAASVAVVLALPWTLLLPVPPAIHGVAANLMLLAAYMALNLVILMVVRHFARRKVAPPTSASNTWR